MFPNTGRGEGPGGKFLGLLDLSRRIMETTQTHSRMIEAAMVERVKLNWRGKLNVSPERCSSALCPAYSGCELCLPVTKVNEKIK